ncbi:hypothetical protein SVAN01_06884 [Stagonosporopsis vannaccii]|nr:hypothetical protein SVAN01_06884 [Stagonosporopsis vannaccii]
MSAPFSSTMIDGNWTCFYSVPANDAQGVPASQTSGTCTVTSTPSQSSSLATAGSTPLVTTTTTTSPVNPNVGGTASNSIANPASSPNLASSSAATAVSNATSSSPPSSTPPASSGNKGLAGGAVAGVAIGMLLAGALISGLAVFFLLRRQRKRHTAPTYTHQHVSQTERRASPEKGTTVVAAAGSSIDDLLPQPVEDETITGDLSKIRDNIKNHVRTFYQSGPISAAEISEVGIRDIAESTNISAAVLVNALSDPTKRDNALRSILAAVILTRTTGDRNPNLLPGDLSNLSTSISGQHSSNRELTQLHHRILTDVSEAAQLVLFSKWKTITGALLQQRYEKQFQDPARAKSFQDAITSLDVVLAPFVKGSVDVGQRRKNLEMILTRAANFAFLLFTQPGSFRFDFTSHQGGLTVFPALLQIIGDQGQPLSPVKVLTEKEVTTA